MKDWKTTLLGIIALAAFVVKSLTGVEVSVEVQSAFVAVILFLIGLFARDSTRDSEDAS